jgi:glyoxylase-like metal-dependent hydrolase (beta-lactamase superfamily II)
MKVHLLRCASMCPLGGKLPPAVLSPALTCNCLLIETSEGLVLVDSGFGLADMADPGRLGLNGRFFGLKPNPEETAYRQVTRLGFSPGDVTHIIPTHLDLDHAGGLADFPNAKIHVLEAERDAALSPTTFARKSRYLSCHFRHEAKWQTYRPEAGEKWNGFQRVRALRGLPPEILMISLPGHTPGHAGVAVSRAQGWILHAGDAYFDRRQLEQPPTVNFGLGILQRFIHEDRKRARKTVDRLRELKNSDPGIQVLCAHDISDSSLTTAKMPS